MSFDPTEGLFDAWNPESGAAPPSRPGAGMRDSLNWLGAASAPPGPAPGGPRADDDGPADFLIASVDPAEAVAPAAGPGTVTAVAAERPVTFPRLGEALGGFRLVAELGRGAFARVYLAHEVALGNRPVALKVSKAEGDEPRILARLQHTHIVPIYSLHDDPATGLRLICMPYFGGANLAQVLDAAGVGPSEPARGRSLIDALDLVGLPAPAREPSRPSGGRTGPIPSASRRAPGRGRAPASSVAASPRSLLARRAWPRARPASSGPDAPAVEGEAEAEGRSQPARRFLQASGFARASAWIAARLAEGLDHAHSRGLVHRDLKPSNVLIAADGTPMLLDFNLAAEAAEADPDVAARAMMGGTLPYMAPEHLDAFNPRGSTPPEAVDERSDIYALGLILFEMAAGRPAFADPPRGIELAALMDYMTAERLRAAPSLRAATPGVPWGLDAIVAKCLAPDPGRRYRTAGELAEDLRRFLDDQPLKFTPDPSLRERLGKWSRRHPRASSAWTIGIAAVALTALIAGLAVSQAGRLREVAARLNLRRFRESFRECQFLLNTSSGGDLTDHLRRGLEHARSAVDRYGVAGPDDWERGYWVAPLAPEERHELRRDLAELMMLEARALVSLAGDEEERRKALESAVARLDRAEALDPSPSPALFADRARYQQALGRADLARLDRDRRDKTPPSSARDEYLLGTAELAAGRADLAESRLARAVALDPSRFWSWFALGLCHYDQRRFVDSVGDFSVCTVLAPEFAWPFANRGFALSRAGRLVEAIASFDRALALSPSFVDALAGRGLARLEAGEADRAALDLERAIALGRREPILRAALADALARAGQADRSLALYDELIADRPDDPRLHAGRGMTRLRSRPDAAEADFRAALRLDPANATANLGLARLRLKDDPATALGHVDRALGVESTNLDARELRALLLGRLGRPEAVAEVDRLAQAPTPRRLYNAACALALLARARPDLAIEARALDLLRRAVAAGFSAAAARDDADFQALRDRPEFRSIVDAPR